MATGIGGGFLRAVRLERDEVPGWTKYPFAIPAVRHLDELALHPAVTFLVGENGSGKSTLIEAIAVAVGLNAEGGTRNFRFSTRASESDLHRWLRPIRNPQRPSCDFFLRAETFYNVATEGEALGMFDYKRNVHGASHGEAFLWLLGERFEDGGLYILDEPEAALSPQRQLAALRRVHDLVRGGSQFIIATHAPILMAYPNATIYLLDDTGIRRIAFEDTEHFTVTRDFMLNRDLFLHHLLEDESE